MVLKGLCELVRQRAVQLDQVLLTCVHVVEIGLPQTEQRVERPIAMCQISVQIRV